MFVLVHGISEVLAVESGEVSLGACPTSHLWIRVFDRAVAPVLLINSALDMLSGK